MVAYDILSELLLKSAMLVHFENKYNYIAMAQV